MQEMLTHTPSNTSTHGIDEPQAPVPDSGEVIDEEDTVSRDVNSISQDPENKGQPEPRESPCYPPSERKQVQFYDPSSVNVALSGDEPASLSDALASGESDFWKDAIDCEMKSLSDHSTWCTVSTPEGVNPLQTRFVFRKKKLEDGTVGRYKARLVIKGYLQGNVDRTFAPVADFTTVRTALALALQRGSLIHQMDARTAFLQG